MDDFTNRISACMDRPVLRAQDRRKKAILYQRYSVFVNWSCLAYALYFKEDGNFVLILKMNKEKVFGIGLSRTGTTTLDDIFQQLGLRSKHFVGEMLSEPDWQILECYEAFSDSPIPKYFKYLDELYPDSKFILTTRNKSSWLSSMKWLLSEGKEIFNWDIPTNLYHQEFYGTSEYDEKILNKFWEDYHHDVLMYFSKRDNLLVVDIDEGFKIEVICNFLQVPYKEVIIEKKNARRISTFWQKVRLKKMVLRGKKAEKSL